MRFGIFGDIHSNLEALEAVLEDMQAQAVTHTVCIGDIVGYNANPRECLEIVRALGCPIVKGNHDEEASEGREVEHFNDMALSAIRFTRAQLTKEQREFLRALPLQRRETLLDCRHLYAQSRGDLIGSRRPASLQRTAYQFGTRRLVVGSSIVCGGEDLFILADDNSLH